MGRIGKVGTVRSLLQHGVGRAMPRCGGVRVVHQGSEQCESVRGERAKSDQGANVRILVIALCWRLATAVVGRPGAEVPEEHDHHLIR